MNDGNEESRPDNKVDMKSWFNRWESSPSWDTVAYKRVKEEFLKFKQALVDIESESPKGPQRLTTTLVTGIITGNSLVASRHNLEEDRHKAGGKK